MGCEFELNWCDLGVLSYDGFTTLLVYNSELFFMLTCFKFFLNLWAICS